MTKTISSTLRSLLFFLAAGMFLFSCEENKEEEVKPSSAASITSLTLMVGDTDYAITFEDRQDTITVPYATELPATATVKAVTLSAKATGIKVGDSVTLPVSGTVTFTVTAEDDKTTGVYTITVDKEAESVPQTPEFNAGNLARDALSFADFKPDQYRTTFVTFSIATGTASAGEYRIGAKRADAPAPTAQELIDATAAYTRTLGADTINIYLPFHIEGTHFDDGTTKTYATISNTMLSPNTAYKIYVTANDGSGEVEEVLEVTTDSKPVTISDNAFYGIPSGSYSYTFRATEPLIWFMKGAVVEGGTITVLIDGSNATFARDHSSSFSTMIGVEMYDRINIGSIVEVFDVTKDTEYQIYSSADFTIIYRMKLTPTIQPTP